MKRGKGIPATGTGINRPRFEAFNELVGLERKQDGTEE